MLIAGAMVALTVILVYMGEYRGQAMRQSSGEEVKLPSPRTEGGMSVEEAILRRRSIRDYKREPLTLEEVSQLLWAAQGITSRRGFRSSPSAGATYPMVIFLAVKEGGVIGLEAGIYRYDPWNHSLTVISRGDPSFQLYRACLDQEWVRSAPVNVLLFANFTRTTSWYGERGVRYVYMEAGHIGQNIYLQATALRLGTVAVGAFYDEQLQEIVGMELDPLYVFPVGRPLNEP